MTRITAAVGLTGPLLVRRFLADYARNPVNLLILVLVPDRSLAIWAREPAAAATNATGTRTSISKLTGLRA